MQKRYTKEYNEGTIKREHSHSLAYATKSVKELTSIVETATKLWA